MNVPIAAISTVHVQRAFMDGPLYSGPNQQQQGVRVTQSLTAQQNKVLQLLGEGLLNKQIAYRLSVSEATVKAHVSAILQKLDASGRFHAVQHARRDGLIAGCEPVGAG